MRFKHIEEPIRPDADEATVYVGEAEFSGIECYKRPKGERRCPRNLTVPFTVYDDGHNCPPWVLWYKPKRERYFTLWRDEVGNWQLGGAWRRFGRR